MRQCDKVITHGGTGAIIGAVKAGKKVIVVPRLSSYGEHVDDHQLQIMQQFDSMGIILGCKEIDDLEGNYLRINNVQFHKYETNTASIIRSIESFLGES